MTPQTTLKLLSIFYALNIALSSTGYFLGCDQPALVVGGGEGDALTKPYVKIKSLDYRLLFNGYAPILSAHPSWPFFRKHDHGHAPNGRCIIFVCHLNIVSIKCILQLLSD